MEFIVNETAIESFLNLVLEIDENPEGKSNLANIAGRAIVGQNQIKRIVEKVAENPRTATRFEKQADKVLEKIANSKVIQKFEERVEQLKHKYLKDEDSIFVMKALKALTVSLPMVGTHLTYLISPFMWIVLFLVKEYATKENISMVEAWKRLFKFDVKMAQKKWTFRMVMLFTAGFLTLLLTMGLFGGSILTALSGSGLSISMFGGGAIGVLALIFLAIYFPIKIMAIAMREGK